VEETTQKRRRERESADISEQASRDQSGYCYNPEEEQPPPDPSTSFGRTAPSSHPTLWRPLCPTRCIPLGRSIVVGALDEKAGGRLRNVGSGDGLLLSLSESRDRIVEEYRGVDVQVGGGEGPTAKGRD